MPTVAAHKRAVCNTPASAAPAMPSREAHGMTNLGTHPSPFISQVYKEEWVWAQGTEDKAVPLHSTREDSE